MKFRFIGVALVLAAGCRSASVALDTHALSDPSLVIVDAGAPRLDFPISYGADSSGSLVLGQGWATPDAVGDDPDWRRSAWAAAAEVGFYVTLPDTGALDLYLRALPFPWTPDARPQTVQVRFGTRALGQATLAPSWQDARISLPDDLARDVLLTLTLAFGHTERPADLGVSPDSRDLAAVFSELAVVPRSVVDPRSFARAARFDSSRRRVTLPQGGRALLRLPRRAAASLSLANIETTCDGCRIDVEVISDGFPARAVASAVGRSGGKLSVELTTPTDVPSHLRLTVTASTRAPAGTAGPPPTVAFDLLPRAVATVVADSPRRRPDVFIYLIDTLRADAVTPYGAAPDATPYISAFARDAVVYADAHAPSTWTLPSVASLLTGLLPDRHGLLRGEPYRPETGPNLPGVFAAAGYRTASISQSFVSGPTFGFDAGFGSMLFSDHLNSWNATTPQARLLLGRWLSSPPASVDDPAFAFIHTIEPHSPYFPGAVPPGQPREAYWPGEFLVSGLKDDPAQVATFRGLYESDVRIADREFGRFVDYLKWTGDYEHSVIVLVSDHGEEFFEHGGVEHGRTLYGELTRIPLVIKYPRSEWAGRREDSPASLVDVMPTVLAAAGVRVPDQLDGLSLVPSTVDATRKDRPLYFRTAPLAAPGLRAVDLRGVQVRGLKCIVSADGEDQFGRPVPRWQAFDLDRDPKEQSLKPQNSPAVALCQNLLARWPTSATAPAAATAISPEIRARLRALGYVR